VCVCVPFWVQQKIVVLILEDKLSWAASSDKQ
jgi:hypothetical protein